MREQRQGQGDHRQDQMGDAVEQAGVPELQRRGIFRTEYEGTTLRENLGLKVPENRYTRAARLKEAS